MENEQVDITINQKRKYICEIVSEFTYDDIVSTYKFLSSHVHADQFSVHGNGCSINLDNVKDKIISLLYNYVCSKRDE